jgi:hypothetical protein
MIIPALAEAGAKKTLYLKMDDIKTILQKLKPLYKKADQHKLDKIWTLYQASDWIRKKEIEETVGKLAARYQLDTVDDQIVLPPPEENLTGDISIGNVSYLGKELFDYKIKLSELTRHAGIFGSTGTGKTTLARHIIRDLVKNKIPFIVFDWESSYRGLAKEFPQIKIYTIGKKTSPFRFNFFKVPPGIAYKEYVKNVIGVFSGAYLGGVGSDTILKRAFDAAYGMSRIPLLNEIKAILDSSMKGKHNMRGREMLWKQSAMRMIEFMLYGATGDMYNIKDENRIEGLFDQSVIFELGGLANANDKRFFTEILTLWYTLRLEHQGIEDEHLKHVLVFEEFHNIVENSEKEDFIHRAFRQLRKYGTGILAIDQTPSQIPNSIFENMGTKITFSLDHQANVKAVANAMYMDKEQVQFIGLLKIGEAIVRSKERYPYPFLIQVPFTVKPGHMSDDEIKTLMKPFSVVSGEEVPDLIDSGPLLEKEGYEYTPLGGELILLQEIAISPFIGVDQRNRKLGLSSRQGNEYKTKLLDHGYLKPVSVDRKVLLELTNKSRDYLKLKNFNIPSQAKGGVEHNYWLEKIKEYFKKNEGFPFKEKNNIDLVVECYNSTVMIQIETGKSDIKKNIETLLKLTADRLIMIATNPQAALKIKSILENINLPEKEKIEIYLAKDFLSENHIA